MDLSKSLEYLDPINQIDGAIHIIGIGAMGSRIAELLVRLGVPKIHIWDMDTVESKNITNQAYLHTHIGMKKTDALESLLKDINPTLKVVKHGEYKDEPIAGYVFLCVDSIELRYNIAKENINNTLIKAMFDTRMRLEDAQAYAAKWDEESSRNKFINTMKFTDEEAKDATPVSACGTTLSVASTVVTTAALTVSNFINLVRKNELKEMIFINTFEHTLITY